MTVFQGAVDATFAALGIDATGTSSPSGGLSLPRRRSLRLRRTRSRRTALPYREHAPITRQEHEAWDVLLACQGQLRLAPSGNVSGVDMGAALKIGAARGYDMGVLSELRPAAEAGLVKAMCAQKGRPD